MMGDPIPTMEQILDAIRAILAEDDPKGEAKMRARKYQDGDVVRAIIEIKKGAEPWRVTRRITIPVNQLRKRFPGIKSEQIERCADIYIDHVMDAFQGRA